MASATTTTTTWTKGPDESPLYSDWKISFVTSPLQSIKDERLQDGASVGTSATTSSSEDDSVSSNGSATSTESSSSLFSPNEVVFSIHRNMIGPKSVFFTKEFLGAPNNKCSVIGLPSILSPSRFESVVEAFELFLEYCYSGMADNLNIIEERLTTETAVEMFCLCNYFGMDSTVSDQVRSFLKTDLNEDTVALYYEIVKDLRSAASAAASFLLDAEPILNMVVLLCHHNPQVLSPFSDLSKIADLVLWKEISTILSFSSSSNDSKIWSENLVHFLDHSKDVDSEAFRMLTSETVIPEVSSEIALRLLELESLHHRSIPDYDDDDVERTAGLTNLQERCIQALHESNWSGDKNDPKKVPPLTKITTPAVLEALLIKSIAGERKLGVRVQELEASLQVEQRLRVTDQEMLDYHEDQHKVALAKERQTQQVLQRALEEKTQEHKATQERLNALQAKTKAEIEELVQAKAILEKSLEDEKQKAYSMMLRYRALESAQSKSESDRELFAMTVKEVIQRLESITNTDDDWYYYSCGLTSLMMAMNVASDHEECANIKAMLQQVLKDPSVYERDYLLRNLTFQTTISVADEADDDDEETSKI